MITYNLSNSRIAVNKKPKRKIGVIEEAFQSEVKSGGEVNGKVLCLHYPDTIHKK
jgi:hypothetical protein